MGKVEAKRLHENLLHFLNNEMPKKGDQFNDVWGASHAYLTNRDLSKCKSMSNIMKELETKGLCHLGNYDTLKILLRDCSILKKDIWDKIKDTENEINNGK